MQVNLKQIAQSGATVNQKPLWDGTNWIPGLQDNLAAVTAPTVNDDSGAGYEIGSRWYDTALDEVYECLDASVGAAVWVQATEAVPVASNKSMVVLVAAVNYALATNTTLAATPARDGYVAVAVNGQLQTVGDAVRTADCYFSADAGLTARAIADIAVGDELYWNAVIAAFPLAITDLIDLFYNS
jgi:hypothetical protein